MLEGHQEGAGLNRHMHRAASDPASSRGAEATLHSAQRYPSQRTCATVAILKVRAAGRGSAVVREANRAAVEGREVLVNIAMQGGKYASVACQTQGRRPRVVNPALSGSDGLMRTAHWAA